MYKLTFMSSRWVGIKLKSDISDATEAETINQFVEEGLQVLLVSSLDNLEEIGININDVQMVECDSDET